MTSRISKSGSDDLDSTRPPLQTVAAALSKRRMGSKEALAARRQLARFLDLDTTHVRIGPACWCKLSNRTLKSGKVLPPTLTGKMIDTIVRGEAIYGLTPRYCSNVKALRVDIDAHDPSQGTMQGAHLATKYLLNAAFRGAYAEPSAGGRGFAIHVKYTGKSDQLAAALTKLVRARGFKCGIEIQGFGKVVSLHRPLRVANYYEHGPVFDLAPIIGAGLSVVLPAQQVSQPPLPVRTAVKMPSVTTTVPGQGKLARLLAGNGWERKQGLFFILQRENNGNTDAATLLEEYERRGYATGPRNGKRAADCNYIATTLAKSYDPSKSDYSITKAEQYVRSRVAGHVVRKYRTNNLAVAGMYYLACKSAAKGVQGQLGRWTCTVPRESFLALGEKLCGDGVLARPWNEKDYTAAFRCAVNRKIVLVVVESFQARGVLVGKGRTIIPGSRPEMAIALKALSQTIYRGQAAAYLHLLNETTAVEGGTKQPCFLLRLGENSSRPFKTDGVAQGISARPKPPSSGCSNYVDADDSPK